MFFFLLQLSLVDHVLFLQLLKEIELWSFIFVLLFVFPEQLISDGSYWEHPSEKKKKKKPPGCTLLFTMHYGIQLVSIPVSEWAVVAPSAWWWTFGYKFCLILDYLIHIRIIWLGSSSPASEPSVSGSCTHGTTCSWCHHWHRPVHTNAWTVLRKSIVVDMRQPLLPPRARDEPATTGLLWLCACKMGTATQPTSSRMSDSMWKHHSNIENNNMSPAQWSFFERGGHKHIDSQTTYCICHVGRQKTTPLFTVQQTNTGNRPVQAKSQPETSTSCCEMFGILQTCWWTSST